MRSTEVVIVGSGPAGAAAASALVEAGTKVVMLEAGKRPDPDRFAVMDRAILGGIPWVFDHVPYEMVGDDIDLNVFAIRMLGGSSLAWGGITPRFQINDFRLRSQYGIAEDWPITYEELEPYYGRAERFMGVSGAQDNPYAAPRSEPFPMANFPMSDSDLLIKEAAAKLDIQMHAVPVARNSTPYNRRSACLYYGTCRACPIGAMYGSDRTVTELERSDHFEVLTQATARRVELDSQGRAAGVVYTDENGKEDVVRAQKVILAAQCVENVRILLNSPAKGFANGIANNNGQLGLRFMEHPKFYMRGRVKQRLNPFRQGFETATTYKFCDHPKRDEYSGGRLLVRENAGPSGAQLAQRSGNWGKPLRDEIVSTFGHYLTLGAFLEQLPHDVNRITLSDRVEDASGSRAARVDFKLVRDYEQRGYREMSKVMVSILESLGATEIELVLAPSNSGHYMGGHTMGVDRDRSVLKHTLETHEVENLYLLSGGAFPTSAIANPTLTTVALAFRMVSEMRAGG
jgi:glucose dehydrogenase